MLTHIENSHLVMPIIFFSISVIVCIFQSIMKKKIIFLSVCKALIFVPITYIVMRELSGLSAAYWDMSVANDISLTVRNQGISRLSASISLGLRITIILYLRYAITETSVVTQKT